MALGPAYGGDGSGFQLFKQADNQDGVYADAAARDVYFGANPSDLARLDGNESLIIKLLDNGSAEVAYQQRSGAAWLDVTSLVTGPSGSSVNFAAITEEGQIPSLGPDLTNYEYSGATRDPVTGEWTFDKSVSVPQASIKISDTLSVSEATFELFTRDAVSDTSSVSVTSTIDQEMGSSKLSFQQLPSGQTVIAQADFSQTLTANPLVVPLLATLTNQTDKVTIKTGSALTNFRATITDDLTGIVVKYIPSKSVCVTGVGGLNLRLGDNVVNFNSDLPDDPGNGLFYIGFTPLRQFAGQASTLTMRADSMNILGNIGGIPYLENEIHFLELTGVPFTKDITNVADNYTRLNNEYTSTTESTAGIVATHQATVTTDQVTVGQFTAGVVSTTNPTVITDGSDTFSQDDLVQFTGSVLNDGLYEVEDHTGTLLTIRGVGAIATVEKFTAQDFVTTEDSATLTKVDSSIFRLNTTGLWELGSGSATGITNWKGVSRVGDELVEVFTAADIDDLATGGVITVADGTNLTLDMKTSLIVSATRFVMEGSSEFRITSELADATYAYSGTSDFMSGTTARTSIDNIVMVSISTGAFLNLMGGTLNILNSAIIGWADLGTMTSTIGGTFLIRFSSIINNTLGFKTTNMGMDLLGVGVNTALDGNFLEINSNTVPILVTLRFDGNFAPNAGVRIDPGIFNNTKVIIRNSNILTGTLFDTTGGSTGSFTLAADAAVALTAITSVTDSSGVARFNFTPGPTLFLDQEITLDSFLTASYNETGIITATGAGFFEIASLAYVDPDTGNFSGNSVTLTDTATSLVTGDTLVIDTENSLDYDGGSKIYNQLTNTFQINREFTGTRAGTWDTSGLDQTDPRVLATDNPGSTNSTVKAEIIVSGNVSSTDIPAVNAKVMINATSWVTQTAERVKTDADGDAILTSNEEVAAKLDGNVLLEPANSVKALSCQFVRQNNERLAVTFTNATNLINETATPRVNGNNLTFHDTKGTLPTGLRFDIIYYVINANANDFQLSYTLGGAAVTFVDDGSGTNSYAVADIHGSKPVEPIAANSPRTLVPQALEDIAKGDKTFIIISNDDDATDITVTDAYYRIVI